MSQWLSVSGAAKFSDISTTFVKVGIANFIFAGLLSTFSVPAIASPVQVIECSVYDSLNANPRDFVDSRFTIRRHIVQTQVSSEINTEIWNQAEFHANGNLDVTFYPFLGDPKTDSATSIRTTILDGKEPFGDEYLDEALVMEKAVEIEGFTVDSLFIRLWSADGTAINEHLVVPDQIDRPAWDEWSGKNREPECLLVWRAPGEGAPCQSSGGLLCTTGAQRGTITSITNEAHEAEHDGSFSINAGLNDAWVSADAPFQGFFFTVFPDLEFFFLSWFTFDSEQPHDNVTSVFGAPDQRWVTGTGFYVGDSVTLNVELTSGGIFNASEPLAVQQSGYGTITIVFNNCNEAVLTYAFPSAGLSGEITLTRVVPDNVALCEALNTG
jgi:hypothetical protein